MPRPSPPAPSLPRGEWVLLVALFVVWVLSPALGGLAGADGGGEALENKTLAAFPRPKKENLRNAKWGPRFEEWLEDHLPLRARWIDLDHRLDFYGWMDSPVPDQVVIGREGFLWSRERIHGRRSMPRPSAASLIKVIERLDAVARSEGLIFRVVISPNKATLYPQALPSGYSHWFVTQALPEVKALERYAQTPNSPLVDVWTPLRAERDRLADPTTPIDDPRLRTLWRRSDRHWSVETGQLQARAILESLPDVQWWPEVAPVVGDTYTDLESELSSIYLKVGLLEPYTTLHMADDLRMQRRVHRLESGLQVQSYFRLATSPLPTDERRLVVVRDSFLNYLGPSARNAHGGGILALASHFRAATFVHRRSVVAEEEGVHPPMRWADIVVFQTVQGNAGQLVEHEAAFVAALRAAGEKD